MASKKYILAAALLGLLQTATFAQSSPGSASDAYVFDSSKVAVKNLPQYSDFTRNAYPYPAKPKSQWEIGGTLGHAFILGDHRLFSKNNIGGTYNGGFVAGISARKALSHVISVRFGYTGSIVSLPHQSFKNNPSAFPAAKNYTHAGSVEFIASLNTISNYRGNPKTNIYVLGGYDLVATYVETYKAGNPSSNYRPLYYPTNEVITTFGGTDNPSATAAGRKNWALLHAFSFGGGFAFKLNEKFNLAFEEKFLVPVFGNDYLDGVKSGVSSDSWVFSTVRLNYNIGNSATHVAPLWWINPNNYVYSELNQPKHLQITPKLPDADGDGVTDQFDLEPNTPAGAPVDSHGRAKDTDGDGVPDYKDKELTTPQSWFPVNADGVGTPPEPACCKEVKDKLKEIEEEYGNANKCNLTSLPSISFKAGSYKLSKEAQTILTSAATQLKNSPKCNVKVVGYVTDASKKAQQLSWDRVNSVIKYLVEKQGIAESRIIFSYDTQGTSNSVDLIPTKESGPNTVPAPAPNFRSKN